MKLSEYIKGLQEFIEKNGDMNCYYAIDDEGNGYQQVNYDGNLYYLARVDEHEYQPELYSESLIKEMKEDGELDKDNNDFIKVCVVN